MTHTKPMAENEGTFQETQQTKRSCPSCKREGTVTCSTWESSCGGYEDEKFVCSACGYSWWVEGPDA